VTISAEHAVKDVGVFTAKVTDPATSARKVEVSATTGYDKFYFGGVTAFGQKEAPPPAEGSTEPAKSAGFQLSSYAGVVGYDTKEVKASVSYNGSEATAAFYQKVNGEVAVAAKVVVPGKDAAVTGAVEYTPTSETTYKIRTSKKLSDAAVPVRVSVNHKISSAATFKFGAEFDAASPQASKYTAGITYLA
jgi:hypothetical protein